MFCVALEGILIVFDLVKTLKEQCYATLVMSTQKIPKIINRQYYIVSQKSWPNEYEQVNPTVEKVTLEKV